MDAISYNRMNTILHYAIMAYEFELEQQDYESAEDLHRTVLHELDITEDEYYAIMQRSYAW